MITKPFRFALGLSATALAGWFHAEIQVCAGMANPTDPETVAHQSPPAHDAQFSAFGDGGGGFVSRDGRSWTPRAVMPATNWRSACPGNGIVVAIGPDGRLRTCSEGDTWILRDTGVPFALHRVAHGNGRFVAVGNEGALVTSEDGILWTSRSSGTDERLRGAAFGAGRFVVVGYEGTILVSRDGLRWRRRPSGTAVRLQDAAFGNGIFVAVGWHGVILTSPTGLVWTQRSAGTTQHLLRVSTGDRRATRTSRAPDFELRTASRRPLPRPCPAGLRPAETKQSTAQNFGRRLEGRRLPILTETTSGRPA